MVTGRVAPDSWPWWPTGDDDDGSPPPVEPPDLTVYEQDPPEIVAQLLGPDGAPLRVLYDRPVVPFGYQRPSF